MADNTIKNSIVLEGEKEYRAQLAQINREIKESKAAMKAAAAEYESAGKSVTALYQQGDALERTIKGQEDALALMDAQLVKVEGHYGENSRQAVELRTRINNMRAELARTQGELREFQQGLENSADAGNDLERQMGGADNAFARIGEAAERATRDVGELSRSIADAVGQKAIEFAVGGALMDGLKEAAAWAIGEGADGLSEAGYMLSGAGDPVLTQARLAAKDEVDKLWSGRLDGMATASAIETVDTVMDNASLSNPRQAVDITNAAIFQQERFGQSVGAQMERADSMVKTFGTSWIEAFDLMTLGFQNSHDGGEQMLKMFDDSAQTFKQMGYDADDMFSVILNAVNNRELGKDSNLNKGMLNLVNTVTSGSRESAETLTALGLEATDVGVKAQQGGETAAAAYQLILETLLAIEDVNLRNQLGKALFGDNVWTGTGGDIATALLSGFGQTIEADGTTQAAMDALLDNIGDSFAGLKELAGQAAGEITQPLAEGANNAIKKLNEGIDQGDILSGIGNAVIAWGDGLHAMIDPTIAAIGASVDESMSDIAGSVSANFYAGAQDGTDDAEADATAKRWIDVLRGSVDSAAAESEQSEALSGMLSGMLPDEDAYSTELKTFAEGHKAAVVAQMETAYGQTDDADFAAWKAFQAAMINSAYEGSVEEAGVLGEDTTRAATDAIAEAEPDAERAGGDYAEAVIDGMVYMTGEADRAGESIGLSAEEGFVSGAGDMDDAGRDAARGAVAGASSQISAMYGAGSSLGGAFRSGFRESMQINSPSRAAMEDMGYIVDGYVIKAQQERRRLAEAASGLTDALREGVGSSAMDGGSAANGAYSGAQGLSAQDVAQALEGMAVVVDGERVGELTAGGVSRRIAARSMGSVKGLSAAARSW